MEVQSGGLIRLKDFLEEAELQQYFELFRDFLKITKTTQLKYVNSVDLKELGLSKPEQRRYKKIYSKYFEKHYFSKIKSLLSSRKKNEESCEYAAGTPELPPYCENSMKTATKHIIPMEDITINKELGTGEFGVVQQGTWTNDNQRIQVAIKCLGNERVQSNPTEFLKEAAVMHSIEHASVVRLYGVVLHPDSMMLVTELAPLRSLLECLKEYTLRESFTVTTLCSFAEQICDGMAYLESKRLIHRDLAARNILVFNKYKVKISDFGLSRALGVGKDYYQTNYNVNLKLPVAWCAAECITYLRFTSASDVWAYAVTLWEMFSYGFQPWAAFSGHQILTAIDEPNYQRLERPECCPENYYSMMMECWAHDPSMRPRFRELNQRLANMRPTQVIAKLNSVQIEGRRANYLHYREGDIITVVGKDPNSNMCIGVLPNSACGLFDPETTTPFTPPYKAAMSPSNAQGVLGSSKSTGGLLTSTLRSSLSRSDSKRRTYTSKRTIERNMISSPQGEVKHTGHIGLDGAYFGDLSFLNPSDCSDPPPRQIVYPYKPSEDLEETPLLNPHSPSHLTGGGASALPYLMLGPMSAAAPPFNLPSRNQDQSENTLRIHYMRGPEGSVRSKRHAFKSMQPTTSKSFMSKMKSATLGKSFRHEDSLPSTSNEHEYQEISDNDMSPLELTAPDGSVLQKSQTDFSQSLIDEMECMFQSLNVPPSIAENQAFKKSNTPNQRAHTLGNFGKKKPNHCEIVKPMSAHEQKTLETAVALANELTTKSMNDLDAKSEKVPPSPNERSKFHFKFPSIGSQNSSQEQVKEIQGKVERRNFSQEAQSVPDLQSTITEESRLAYASLIEQRTPSSHAPPAYAARAGPGSNASGRTHRYQHKTPLMSSPENHEAEMQMTNNGKDDQMSNILPLPSRGNKPQLIDKTRHIRIHPLVMTDAMLRRADTASRRACPEENHGARFTAPHNSNSHEYQNLIYTLVGAADKREYPTRNTEHNQTCGRPEPDYQNLLTNPGIDVCDGSSTNVNTNELTEDVVSKSSVDSDTATDSVIAKYMETSANASNKEAGTSSENNHEPTPEQTATDPDLGILLKDAPDHVSVEDLLEFADQKPLGRQRGAESDEVRILCKVLNYEMPKVTVDECMEALDHTEWRVHSALKLFRLRAAVDEPVTLRECARALVVSDNDVTQACTLLNLGKPKVD